MGASASKPTETKVFTPQTPVDFSPSLVSQLEKSVETDYTRSQYTEKYLEDKVNEKLDVLLKDSQLKFDETLKNSILNKDLEKDSNLSTSKIDEKISILQKNLNNKESKFIKLSDELIKSKESVSSCLIQNKEKPLNCWDEVKNFEKLVNELK
ncbi:hypothetical protein BN7_912 [Wickerhamomyces ciferrii]|uniref:MICOS complex subunit MIC19 n=1 Tax=Wickerhamomyces ciferrii (strain ATCC 14091 / BCRC 22168 / CBS 111 / JCM 3599 / NBRC 0793 / NRRL Y-1031 F-60-10) TaxID=1206466 RepID=K0KJU0_WICCF|nr:uncharacterized protein BN7_912 [Wickerhamomyces ciferrii]CCH41373.1 hypothetical protein BN7_912 [Wickerhamomyces ciferrii]